MAFTPTPSSTKSNHNYGTLVRTPQAKNRLNYPTSRTPNPNAATAKEEHPVEVIGRIRDYPDRKEKPVSILQVNHECHSVRVRTEIGYRDFTLDGVSLSEEEDVDVFYNKFVESRINSVKLGEKCTVMMYGPTGSGKSYTMFGSANQPGIVYRSLKDILGDEESGCSAASGNFVQVTILEIYNEEIYDLLPSTGTGGFGFGWPKGGSASKVKLEVMGKKAKNATFISGNEAGKISKEIQKVEKRRIVKSTLCNERSSRSHCMIILDVPKVGGRLMLVDMAGSENIEQAGQAGFEAKMQTAKINQGNIALKRVVESIANGDSHVPFRDSKLTMLLQDSFEDDKSKILMILCASPDPKEIYKTISTLEYGAKAKCIVRGPHTPVNDKLGSEDASVILGSRLAAMDQFISKLQKENKIKEKERDEAHKELMKKEEEIVALRTKLKAVEGKGIESVGEDVINSKVAERTRNLKLELEKQIEECKKMTDRFVELERKRMEQTILQQQQEVEILRRRLQEVELELNQARGGGSGRKSVEGSGFAKRLMAVYASEDPGMVMSMELDMDDVEPVNHTDGITLSGTDGAFAAKYNDRVCLSTVFEEEAEGTENGHLSDEEVRKEVIEEKRVCSTNESSHSFESVQTQGSQLSEQDSDTSRQLRIQNIFTLCGGYRELSHNIPNSKPLEITTPSIEPPLESVNEASKENNNSFGLKFCDEVEVFVKWEASKENAGKFITTLKLKKDASLADARKLIEIHFGADNIPFTFLVLGDPTGAPISKEKETTMQVRQLPICNNQLKGHLACLRSLNGSKPPATCLPFSPLENKLPITPVSCYKQQTDCFSPKLAENIVTTPFITTRKHKLPSSSNLAA
ncbi:unnamed protein product [Rhodiola kirilowii]